jgi:hypothetical protein
MKTILFCGANPLGQRTLRIDHEAELIRRELRSAGSPLRIEHRLAVTLPELQAALLDVKPDWLHIACHGEAGALWFLDDAQRRQSIPGSALVRQLKATPGLQGCLLMACESEPTARGIASHMPHAVGWTDPVSDVAALAYTRSFYIAFALGERPEVCHENGCVAVQALGLMQEEPVLHRKQAVGCSLVMNPAPLPDLAALGVPPTSITIDSPEVRWQTASAPGSTDWQRARAGIDVALKQLRGHRGPVEVFVSTAYALAADLGLKLAEQSADAHYWQADGPRGQARWIRWDRAQNHGQPVLRFTEPLALDPQRPVALKVNITASVIAQEASRRAVAKQSEPAKEPASAAERRGNPPDSLPFSAAEATDGLARAGASDAQEVILAHPTPGNAAITSPQAAQQAAWDLQEALIAIRNRVAPQTTHLFYVGPLAILMMAAPCLRTLNPVIIYERAKLDTDTQTKSETFRPALRFEGGRADWC